MRGRLDSSGAGYGLVAGFCELLNEHFSFFKSLGISRLTERVVSAQGS